MRLPPRPADILAGSMRRRSTPGLPTLAAGALLLPLKQRASRFLLVRIPTLATAALLPLLQQRARRFLLVGLPALAAAALLLLLPAPVRAADEKRVVSKAEILAAMEKCQGYVLTATANGPRLQAEVLLRVIADAEKSDPARRPLVFGHREWYEAFLERTKLPPSRAPIYVRMPYEIGQDLFADYRRERVVAEVLGGPQPLRAANVRLWWDSAPGKPEEYSYDDTGSEPNLRVTQKRLIDYRLVDYGDRVWYAEVQGLHGRPTSGALGAIFAVIGETTVIESWSASAPDGSQVVRGHARKWWFDRTETLTLLPSGRGDRGVPPGRPDLLALEKRLKEPLAIRFQPLQ